VIVEIVSYTVAQAQLGKPILGLVLSEEDFVALDRDMRPPCTLASIHPDLLNCFLDSVQVQASSRYLKGYSWMYTLSFRFLGHDETGSSWAAYSVPLYKRVPPAPWKEHR
jgi:hypothetical protein